MTPTAYAYIPTSEQIMALCPEVFAFCMEVAPITLAGRTDLDMECFDACETLLVGGTLDAALAFISHEHPRAEEAVALIKKTYLGNTATPRRTSRKRPVRLLRLIRRQET